LHQDHTVTLNYTELLDQLLAAWNAHDIRAVAELYADDYEEIDVARAQPAVGAAMLRRTLLYYLRAFPDLHITLDDVLVNGERAALYWTWTGTQHGAFMNIPPTGHTVTVRGTSLITLKDGKIQRAVRIWDLAGLLRDLKLLPELTA
jgi:steroid delta-isomerase-like uncharacterized protein